MRISRLLLLFCFWILTCGVINGQTVVGMGTESPNPNAVLELVSANQNQGFLVPRLSTQQRNAAGFTSKLTDQDNGLMIFDTNEGNLYYWFSGAWKSGPGDLSAKGNVWYAGNTLPDSNLGNDGDFYVDQSTNEVFRKQNGTFLLFGSLLKNGNQYFGGAGISISSQNEIINTGDLDATNELQDLSLSGTVLSLSGSATTIDLSPLDIGTDNQNLNSSKAGNEVSLSIDNGNTTTFSVADGDSDSANELIASASLTADDMLRIQEAGNNHDVDLSGFQKKALPTGQVLVGDAAGIASPVSISGDITLNSDGTMSIQLDAVTTAKILNQAITSAKIANGAITKEKINADVAGNGLTQNTDGSLEMNITGGGLQLSSDQLQLMNKNNGEVLIGDGTQVNSRVITGDIILANSGIASVTGLQGKPVGTTNPASEDILSWNGSSWEPRSPQLILASTNGYSWFSGDSAPNALSPSGAVIGDFYYRTDTKRVYRKKENGTWTELGEWVKPSGETVSGATITGTTFPTIYIGTGQPINGTLGNAQPGDMYFNTSEGEYGRIYIKKNNSEWQGL